MKLFNQISSCTSGVLFFAILLIYSNCALEPARTDDPIASIKKLQGKWRVNKAEEFEEWYPADDFPFKGVLYSSVEENKEYLTIEKVGNDIIYKAKVFDKIGSKIIGFKMIDCDDKEINFQNEHHDFPNTITYKFISGDHMEAVVYGHRDAQEIKMTLKFDRVK